MYSQDFSEGHTCWSQAMVCQHACMAKYNNDIRVIKLWIIITKQNYLQAMIRLTIYTN